MKIPAFLPFLIPFLEKKQRERRHIKEESYNAAYDAQAGNYISKVFFHIRLVKLDFVTL